MTPIEPFYLGTLILTGAFTGVISGLLGVGGGFIMSPVQYWLLQETGLKPDLALRIALGTSLFVVLLNASSVVLKYQQKRAVLWRQATIMGLSGLLASFGGAAVASHLPASLCFFRCCNWLFFRTPWDRGRGNWSSDHAYFPAF
jgi:uncharacterized membrane protein YfcA